MVPYLFILSFVHSFVHSTECLFFCWFVWVFLYNFLPNSSLANLPTSHHPTSSSLVPHMTVNNQVGWRLTHTSSRYGRPVYHILLSCYTYHVTGQFNTLEWGWYLPSCTHTSSQLPIKTNSNMISPKFVYLYVQKQLKFSFAWFPTYDSPTCSFSNVVLHVF